MEEVGLVAEPRQAGHARGHGVAAVFLAERLVVRVAEDAGGPRDALGEERVEELQAEVALRDQRERQAALLEGDVVAAREHLEEEGLAEMAGAHRRDQARPDQAGVDVDDLALAVLVGPVELELEVDRLVDDALQREARAAHLRAVLERLAGRALEVVVGATEEGVELHAPAELELERLVGALEAEPVLERRLQRLGLLL